jgi:hypothetical protein
MFRRTFSFGVALLLAGATLLTIPGVSRVKRLVGLTPHQFRMAARIA